MQLIILHANKKIAKKKKWFKRVMANFPFADDLS